MSTLAKREDRRDEDAISHEVAYGPPPKTDATDEQKVTYVLSRYAIQNDHYLGLTQQWTKPIFFLVGKQWWTWNTKRQSFTIDTDVPEWRQQPVTNWTFAVYRSLLAKLTKQRPITEVVPPSGDSDDREAAELGEAILNHLWRLLKCPIKMRRAIGWLLATGNVALKVDWDPDAGEIRPRTALVEMPHPSDPAQTVDVDCACDEQGEPLRRTPDPENPDDTALDGGDPYDLNAEPEQDAIGEQTFEVIDPLSYRWNPEATSEDDATEYFEARMMARQTVADLYDIDADKLKTGGGEAGDNKQAIDQMLESVTGGAPDPFDAKTTATSGNRTSGTTADQVLVIKYYRKPCAKEGYPKGRHYIIAGGMKVWPKKDEADLPHGFWPPVVPIVDCPIPSQPQGLGVLSQVVPLNEKYNYNDGKIGEYHTTMAMGGVIWAHPEDRGIRITSEPGQVKVSKGMAHGHPPIREQLTALPGPVYAEREIIAGNIQAIAATSSLDLGQKPEGVSAGRAFLVIQEATQEVIGPTLEAIENAIAEVGRRQLVVAQQNYTDERSITIGGERGKYQFRSFSNADLSDGLDVRVQQGSSFPWSKAAQLDTKLSVIERFPGYVTDPKTGAVDNTKMAKFLDTSSMGLATFTTEEDSDLVETQREHDMFEAYNPEQGQNELPQIAVWQDQMKHQAAHFDFMKRSRGRFERWSPAAQVAFMEHLRLTHEALTQVVQAMVDGQNAANDVGPPGGGGGGDQPPPDDQSDPGAASAPSPAGPTGPAPKLTKGDRAAAGQSVP